MQPELPINDAKPTATQAEISALEGYLSGSGWRKADAITAATGLSARKIRACAEYSHGRILSHPSKGYHLTSQATPEDFRLARSQLASRIRHMTDRLRASDIAWHSALS